MPTSTPSESRPLLPSTAPPPPPPPPPPPHRNSNGIARRDRAVPSGSSPPDLPTRTRPHVLRRRHASLRHDIWTVLRFRSSVAHSSGLQLASYLLELSILTLVLLNVVLAISESEALVAPGAVHASATPSEWYQTFLFVSTLIFSVEYLLRFWSCVEDERYSSAVLGRLKWMTRPMSIIDLLALVPFYLEISFEFIVIPAYPGALTLRSLRLLRILSFLRLERSYSAMTNLRLIFAKKKEELLVVSYLTAVLVLTSSTTIFFLENAAQPRVFHSVAASAWWSVETITSLGYGDMVPQTSSGKLFGAVLALWGIILFTIPGAILGAAFIEVMLDQQRRDEDDAVSLVLSSAAWELQHFNSSGGFQASSRRNSDADQQDRNGLGSPASPSASQSFRKPSPRVVTAMRLDSVAQRIDEIAAAQLQLQQHVAEQQAELREIKQLLELLVARTEPRVEGDGTRS